jgi:hypothetical protein
MKVVSQFTGICVLNAVYLVATVGKIDQLQGDVLGTVLWVFIGSCSWRYVVSCTSLRGDAQSVAQI